MEPRGFEQRIQAKWHETSKKCALTLKANTLSQDNEQDNKITNRIFKYLKDFSNWKPNLRQCRHYCREIFRFRTPGGKTSCIVPRE